MNINHNSINRRCFVETEAILKYHNTENGMECMNIEHVIKLCNVVSFKLLPMPLLYECVNTFNHFKSISCLPENYINFDRVLLLVNFELNFRRSAFP